MEEGSGSSASTKNTQVKSMNDFEILRVLGKGAYGIVNGCCLMRERKEKNPTLYAAKHMAKELIIKNKSIERVINERTLLATLKHPFVCKMYWAFQDAFNVIIIMEYCAGGDIGFHLKNGNLKLKDSDLPFYAGQLLLACKYMESQRVAHRDIKPANIMLDTDGNCHITDFGISAVYEEGKKLTHCCGTIDYMAPEVARREEYDAKCDIWSLGATLYQMLMRRVIFDGKSSSEIMKILRRHPMPPDSIHYSTSRLNTVTIHFLSAMLTENQNERKSAADLLNSVLFKNPPFSMEDCLSKKMKPPFTPPPVGNIDGNLELEYQMSQSMSRNKKATLSETDQSYFSRWDYDVYNPQPQNESDLRSNSAAFSPGTPIVSPPSTPRPGGGSSSGSGSGLPSISEAVDTVTLSLPAKMKTPSSTLTPSTASEHPHQPPQDEVQSTAHSSPTSARDSNIQQLTNSLAQLSAEEPVATAVSELPVLTISSESGGVPSDEAIAEAVAKENEGLKDGWEAIYSVEHRRIYYMHSQRGESVWTRDDCN